MTTRDRYLPVLEWFFNQVDKKMGLPKNVAKDHWKTEPIRFLKLRLFQEVNELSDALYRKEDSEQIIQECADIAAIAMMIADKHRS